MVKIPPNYWKKTGNMQMPEHHDAASVWEHSLSGLLVLRSISENAEGEKWLHVSVSRKDRVPTWDELSKVKNEFIGEDKEAYQVLAAKKDHVNIATTCLHLFAPMDGVRRVINLQDLIWEDAV